MDVIACYSIKAGHFTSESLPGPITSSETASTYAFWLSLLEAAKQTGSQCKNSVLLCPQSIPKPNFLPTPWRPFGLSFGERRMERTERTHGIYKLVQIYYYFGNEIKVCMNEGEGMQQNGAKSMSLKQIAS